MAGNSLTCPQGTSQVGNINADIDGCGMEACNARYSTANIVDCRDKCYATNNCLSFSWAPTNGDRNHQGVSVCTLYDSASMNQQWGPNQILCSIPPLSCPSATTQVGNINADIGGCGLEACNERYDTADIDDCRDKCIDRSDCKSFSWAPLNGDRNHPGVKVCTLYDSKSLNQYWGPSQILCGMDCRSMSK